MLAAYARRENAEVVTHGVGGNHPRHIALFDVGIGGDQDHNLARSSNPKGSTLVTPGPSLDTPPPNAWPKTGRAPSHPVALIPLGMFWWLGLGVVLLIKSRPSPGFAGSPELSGRRCTSLKRGLVTLVSHNFEDYRGSFTR